ncbi:DUF3306 domain-containing protein [Paracoccus tegillarcae]|uniref:DUF3306 domain-containing protein n=1 Tax=Paracoccus tegillarcae TaxID=1529068 RepID=A0A2K9F2S5_9RHOB|nr:DUF3306 domain-containing protein [Paracoccus tegillarcae]AUH33441.1 DUF3306 domain-containing protein [Paracoccus tegillarcae]
MSDFWTRRKARVEAEAELVQADAHASVQARADAALAEEQAALSEPELLAQLGLPDPDGLRAGDDFTAFLRREVPDFLRRRALRRLWTSNPVLANLDGLVDHDDDFTDAATVKPGMRTAYQVGRGMIDRARAEAEKLIAMTDDQDVLPASEPSLETPPVLPAESSTVRRPTAPRVTAQPQVAAPPPEIAAVAPTAFEAQPQPDMPAARHMQFQFTEAPA